MRSTTDPRRTDFERVNRDAHEAARVSFERLGPKVRASIKDSSRFVRELADGLVKMWKESHGSSNWQPHQGDAECARRAAKAETGIYGDGPRQTALTVRPKRHRRGGIRGLFR